MTRSVVVDNNIIQYNSDSRPVVVVLIIIIDFSCYRDGYQISQFAVYFSVHIGMFDPTTCSSYKYSEV